MSLNLIKYCNNVIPRENIDIFKDPARVIMTGVSNGGKEYNLCKFDKKI